MTFEVLKVTTMTVGLLDMTPCSVEETQKRIDGACQFGILRSWKLRVFLKRRPLSVKLWDETSKKAKKFFRDSCSNKRPSCLLRKAVLHTAAHAIGLVG